MSKELPSQKSAPPAQTQAPMRKRRKKKKDPYFTQKLLAAIVCLIVVTTVVLLLFLENKRDETPGSTDKAQVELESELELALALETADGVLKNGTTEDMLKYVKTNLVNPNSSQMVAYEVLRNRGKVFQELERRSSELNDAEQQDVKISALATLMSLHLLDINSNIEGTETLTTLEEMSKRLLNDPSKEVVRSANLTLCSTHMLQAFSPKSQAEEVNLAAEKMSRVLQLYPKDKLVVGAMYALFVPFIAQGTTTEVKRFYEILNSHCRNSDDETIRKAGYDFEGRLLLAKHKIADINGNIRKVLSQAQTEDLLRNVDAFLAEEYTMSASVAVIFMTIVDGLELKRNFDEVNYVAEKILERIGEDKDYTKIKIVLQQTIKRMNTQGQVIEFPDHTRKEYAFIVFVQDSEKSLELVHTLRGLQRITQNRKLEIIIVSISSSNEYLEKYSEINQGFDYTFVQDVDQTSVYFEAYPARWMPATLIVDPTGKIVAANPSLTFIKAFCEKLRKTL